MFSFTVSQETHVTRTVHGAGRSPGERRSAPEAGTDAHVPGRPGGPPRLAGEGI